MKLIKKNLKLIVGILMGMLLVSGVTAYATYQYYAKDVSYTKADGTEMSVEKALNELYEIKKDYIKPSGTLKIEEKKNDIDVSKYHYADTSKLFTKEEYENNGKEKYSEGYTAGTKKNVQWNSGVIDTKGGVVSVNVGFTPSKIVFIKGNGAAMTYDSRISTTKTWTAGSVGITEFNLNSTSNSYTNIRTIGSVTTIYSGTVGGTWYWFALKD